MVTTQSGLTFLAAGTLVGLVLALVLFSLTVFGMPMLLDTELDFVTAMLPSVRGVLASPVTMLGWGIVVTTVTMVSMLPFFLGWLSLCRCSAMQPGTFMRWQPHAGRNRPPSSARRVKQVGDDRHSSRLRGLFVQSRTLLASLLADRGTVNDKASP